MRVLSVVSRAALAAGFLAAGFGCDSSSDFETYTATLEGAEENPPVSSSATGHAVSLLSIQVSVSGIQNVVGTHIHRGPRGTNGPIIFFLYRIGDGFFRSGGDLGKTWTPLTVDTEGLTPNNVALLRAGNLYVNVHTAVNPSGEVRGQLTRQ